jgi:hypothetical protein
MGNQALRKTGVGFIYLKQDSRSLLMTIILPNLQSKKPAYENRKTNLTPAFKKTLKRVLEFHLRTIAIDDKRNTLLFGRAKNYKVYNVAIPNSNDKGKTNSLLDIILIMGGGHAHPPLPPLAEESKMQNERRQKTIRSLYSSA